MTGDEGGWWWACSVPMHLLRPCLALADPQHLLALEHRSSGPAVTDEGSSRHGHAAAHTTTFGWSEATCRIEGLRALDEAWRTKCKELTTQGVDALRPALSAVPPIWKQAYWQHRVQVEINNSLACADDETCSRVLRDASTHVGPYVHSLSLHPTIPPSHIREIVGSLTNLKRLRLFSIPPVGASAAMQALDAQRRLESLSFYFCRFTNADRMEKMLASQRGCTSLRRLSFISSPIEPANTAPLCSFVASLPALDSLELSINMLDDHAATRILRAFVLQQASSELVDDFNVVTEENFGLGGGGGLCGQIMRETSKGDDQGEKEERARKDKNEEEWWWWDQEGGGEEKGRDGTAEGEDEAQVLGEDFELMKPCARRQGLHLAFTDNAMVDHTFARLVDMIVPPIGADGGEGQGGVEDGKERPRLEWLDLSGNRITERSGHEVALLLRHSPGLTHLDLSENEIGDRTALALADVMVDLSTLSPSRSVPSLSLTSLNLSECGLTCRGAAPLLTSLARLPCLTSLSLAGNLLPSPATSGALAHLLSLSVTITSLDVSHTGLRMEPDLVASLQRTPVLHSLRLAANRLGDPGGGEVLEVLRVNRSIMELDVSANLLRSGFLRGLISVLREGSHDDEGTSGVPLGQERRQGRKLDRLDVRENKFGPQEEKIPLVVLLRKLVTRDAGLLVDMHPLRDSALCDGVQEV